MGCILVAAGCSGSDEWVDAREPVYPISGRVTRGGEPVEGATVIFRSTTKDISGQGMTDADGWYHITTYEDHDGAVAGDHTVTVRKTDYIQKPTKHHTEEEPSYVKIPQEVLPQEYASPETTPLKVTVTAEGADDVDFEF